MTAPTPEDVARLAKTAEVVLGFHGPGGLHQGYELDTALIPFRPDPDAEVIEAMALAYANKADLNLLAGDEITVDRHMAGIRAALAAYRRHTEAK